MSFLRIASLFLCLLGIQPAFAAPTTSDNETWKCIFPEKDRNLKDPETCNPNKGRDGYEEFVPVVKPSSSQGCYFQLMNGDFFFDPTGFYYQDPVTHKIECKESWQAPR
jgi:hypothetical protein